MAFMDINLDAVLESDGQVVVRLFNNGGAAQQAIGELREEGFSTRQIGAAFRSSSTREPSAFNPCSNVSDAGARKFATKEREFGPGDSDGLTPLSEQHVVASFDHAYSPAHFETALKKLGLGQRESRGFTQQLHHAGAIVTVAAGARIEDAESILERNGGRACYAEEASAENWAQRETSAEPSQPEEAAGDPSHTRFSQDRIQLFGDVRRAYEERNHAARNQENGRVRRSA